MVATKPSRAQFEAIKSMANRAPDSGPLDMLNLVRLRDFADYGETGYGETGYDEAHSEELGNKKPITGAEAFKRYAELSAPIFQGLGGEIIWRGSPQTLVIGPPDEVWHRAFIARYPSADAFVALATNKEYLLAIKHRLAAIADSRLICCSPQELCQQFG